MEPRLVYLVQTDTTVGLLSQDAVRLAQMKGRPSAKPFVIALPSLEALRSRVRVPCAHRSRVRQMRRTSIVVSSYPHALRVVSVGPHHDFLRLFGWMYSTSANESGKGFDRAWAEAMADVVVEDARGLFEAPPSQVVRLARSRMKRLR